MTNPTKVTIEVAASPTDRAVLVGVLLPRGDGSWVLAETTPLANLDAGEPQSFEVGEGAALIILPTKHGIEPF